VTAGTGWQLPELDAAALHGIAGEYALAVEPYSEACAAGVLVSALVAFGNAANRGASMPAGGQTHHANENALLAGPTSSGRKGEAMQIGLRPVRHADETWGRERVQRGFGSGEALVDSVRDRENDEEPADKRLLVHEDEFAGVLAVADRQGSTLSAHVRNAWDGRPLQNRVKGSALVATDAHVSVLAAITPQELVRKTPETELANGFLNRFLIVAVKRARLLPIPPPIPPPFDQEHADKFGAALAWARREGAGRMKWSPTGRALWEHAYQEELSVDRYGLAGAVCSRAEAHTLRLAMLFALLDRSAQLDREHVEAALALWRYCEASVRLVFGDRLGDEVADTILDALRSNSGKLTKKSVHDLFSRHRRADEIDRGLALLEGAGYVRVETAATGGRPAVIVTLLSHASLNSPAENGNTGQNAGEKREESDGAYVFAGSEESEVSEESLSWLAYHGQHATGFDDGPPLNYYESIPTDEEAAP
jgi:hypothetical protein